MRKDNEKRMKPIYVPSGKAKEYGDYALNIYTGCPHRCYYCFAPSVLHKDKEQFHSNVQPREGIIEATKKQLEREGITGKLIHLCFTCDPYPTGCDSSATREIIKLLKDAGNHVQILTKGCGTRDFDLLDENDWYGITYAGYSTDSLFKQQKTEPGASSIAIRLSELQIAHKMGAKTWMSMEPVINDKDVLNFLNLDVSYVDRYKIGKLNYHKSDVDWKTFGTEAERICKQNGYDYYIKESLRAEMEK